MSKVYTTNSQAVKELLEGFNQLNGIEQEEVLDIIYDVMYDKSYKSVLKDRVILEKVSNIKYLKGEIDHRNQIIQSQIEEIKKLGLQIQQIGQGKKKKALRNQKKGLLIIIYCLKHYLGDKWYTIFPNGPEQVDKFLDSIDSEGLRNQPVWEKYETVSSDDDKVEIYLPDYADTPLATFTPTQWKVYANTLSKYRPSDDDLAFQIKYNEAERLAYDAAKNSK